MFKGDGRYEPGGNGGSDRGAPSGKRLDALPPGATGAYITTFSGAGGLAGAKDKENRQRNKTGLYASMERRAGRDSIDPKSRYWALDVLGTVLNPGPLGGTAGNQAKGRPSWKSWLM